MCLRWILLLGILVAVMPGVPWLGPAAADVYQVPEQYSTIQLAADACGRGDTVSIAYGTFTGPGNRDIIISRNMTLMHRPGPGQTLIDCQHRGRAFTIDEMDSVVVDGISMINGTGDLGGAVQSSATKTILRNCVLASNRAAGGGAVAAFLDVLFERCSFVGNEATNPNYGGGAFWGIQGFFSGMTIDGCVFSGNRSASYGGAILIDGSVQTAITRCTLAGNFAQEQGGAIYNFDAHLTMTQSICRDNCASWTGSEDIYAESPMTIDCSDVNRNGIYGAGILYGESVIDLDARFCHPLPCALASGGEYSLRSDSPCLPSGNPCGVLLGARGLRCLPPPSGIESTWQAGGPSLIVVPNPTRGAVQIQYELYSSEWTQVKVYDASGRCVKTLADSYQAAGQQRVDWDGFNAAGCRVAAGAYYIRVGAGRRTATTRLVWIQ